MRRRATRGGTRRGGDVRSERLEPRLLLATFTVTTTAASGAGSLRQAITDANTTTTADVIRFNLPAGGGAAYDIRAALPTITAPLDIDGTSQPGYTSAKPLIHLLGAGATSTADALVFSNAGNSRVRGLVINNWGGSGIRVEGTTTIVIESNWIGIDNLNGTLPVANGVGIYSTSNGGRIGGTSAAQRNVISGNTVPAGSSVELKGIGIDLRGDDNVVIGNFIGTSAAGTAAVANTTGIRIRGSRNRVGGTTAGERNVVSGNVTGVWIGQPGAGGVSASFDNVVEGNYIGTDPAGTAALPNTGRGVWVREGSDRALVGGTAAGSGNVISGNNGGITVEYPGAFNPSGVQAQPPVHTGIEGNLIGLSAAGAVLGNTTGVNVSIDTTVIGGTAAGAGNVISGNATGISTTLGPPVVQGNYIGTSVDGTAARPNNVGIFVDSIGTMTIGGTVPGARNVISGNTAAGIRVNRGPNITISGMPTIQGNYVGTDATGARAIGNGAGIELVNTGGALIGGDTDAARNVISGNGDGVRINTTAGGATVRRNFIGTAADGVSALRNIGHGVFGASTTLTGCVVESNVIAFNGGDGIRWMGSTNNSFVANSIHDNGGLGIDLGGDGVTPNDPQDADTGPNDRQNFPVLTSVLTNGTQTTVRGTVAGRPFVNHFRVEFFASVAADPSGYGEGATPLGDVTVTTDGSGAAAFTATLPAVQSGRVITATATLLPATGTNPAEQTSEFSAAVTVPPADVTGPTVTGVYAGSTSWSASFFKGLQQVGVGDVNGFSVPGGAAQLRPLPWTNVNQISIRFAEAVDVRPGSLVVRASVGDGGAAPGQYAATLSSVSGLVATWKLSRPVAADRLVIELASGGADGVKDLAGNPLDGEWADGADDFPSGDGAAGADFHFRLNVLPADADRNGVVNVLDLASVRRAIGSSLDTAGVPSGEYSVFDDLDGNGRIGATDLAFARVNQRHRLPAITALS